MTETTETPTYLRRLVNGSEWYGVLTLENLDLVAGRLRTLLDGRRYTFVASNEGRREWFPEVRTSQRMHSVKVSQSTLPRGRVMGHLNVSDTYGVWGVSTTVPDVQAAHALSYEEQRKQGGYLHIYHNRIEIEHYAPACNRLVWVAAVEQPED